MSSNPGKTMIQRNPSSFFPMAYFVTQSMSDANAADKIISNRLGEKEPRHCAVLFVTTRHPEVLYSVSGALFYQTQIQHQAWFATLLKSEGWTVRGRSTGWRNRSSSRRNPWGKGMQVGGIEEILRKS